MSFDTYGGLKTEVAAWLDRTDLGDRLTGMVELAEARIRREVKWVPEVYSAAFGDTLTYSTTPMTLPLYVRGVRAAWLADSIHKHKLTAMTANDWRELVQGNADATGNPTRFFVAPLVQTFGVTQGPKLWLWPRPAGSVEVDLYYDRDLTYPGIVAAGDGGASSLLLVHPDLYLYATLLEAAPYLQHDERVPGWERRYAAILKGLRIEAETALGLNAGVPMRLPRVFG